MGRTNPTFRDALRRTEDGWSTYRRALRYEDREAFDRLFERAHAHADAAGQQNPTDPWKAVVLSMLVAQERELAALKRDLRTLDRRLADGEQELQTLERKRGDLRDE